MSQKLWIAPQVFLLHDGEAFRAWAATRCCRFTWAARKVIKTLMGKRHAIDMNHWGVHITCWPIIPNHCLFLWPSKSCHGVTHIFLTESFWTMEGTFDRGQGERRAIRHCSQERGVGRGCHNWHLKMFSQYLAIPRGQTVFWGLRMSFLTRFTIGWLECWHVFVDKRKTLSDWKSASHRWIVSPIRSVMWWYNLHIYTPWMLCACKTLKGQHRQAKETCSTHNQTPTLLSGLRKNIL